jgi:hypothetical protein
MKKTITSLCVVAGIGAVIVAAPMCARKMQDGWDYFLVEASRHMRDLQTPNHLFPSASIARDTLSAG